MSQYQHLQGQTVEYHLHLTDEHGAKIEKQGIGTLAVEEIEGESFLSIQGQEPTAPAGGSAGTTGTESVSYTVTDYRLAVLCPHPDPTRAAFQLIEPPAEEET